MTNGIIKHIREKMKGNLTMISMGKRMTTIVTGKIMEINMMPEIMEIKIMKVKTEK